MKDDRDQTAVFTSVRGKQKATLELSQQIRSIRPGHAAGNLLCHALKRQLACGTQCSDSFFDVFFLQWMKSNLMTGTNSLGFYEPPTCSLMHKHIVTMEA